MASASPFDILDAQSLTNVNAKGFVTDDARDAIFRKIRMKQENRTCFDCPTRNPSWISTSHGIFLCLECSGNHRRMGVHISYVRSCELDSFFPDQIVQMACGGNAKACRFYKEKGMGKTSELGKAVDYHSKIAATYKAQLEKEAQAVCAKLGVVRRGGETGSSVQEPVVAAVSNEAAVVSPAWSAVPMQSSMGTAAAAPKPALAPKPAQMSTPMTTVVRKSASLDFDFSAAAPAPTSQGYPSPKAAATPAKATNATPVAFSNSKQMSKEIDFDFDFDELEKEANAPPPPKPAPAPVSVAPTPPPAVKAKPAPVASPEEKASVSKFSSRKAISSEDFFPSDEVIVAKGQLKGFTDAQNISSDSLFGGGSTQANGKGAKNGDNATDFDDWMESALQGISKGTDYISTYLNKGFE
mmetsp:Transcript_104683/g.223778  ORF Transcript_104683/g.223778 Transcript_104683/m.223778 type:complete len:412 (-) Transcript_104683:164-1399(-)